VYEQLNLSPGDFFENELSKDNFLRPAISSLFMALDRPGLESSLFEHKRRLLTFLQKKFNLFDELEADEEGMVVDRYNLVDEDRPVIVPEEDILRAMGDGTDDTSTRVRTHEPTDEYSSLHETVHGNVCAGGEMSQAEIEKAMYCWRYPNLYDAMCSTGALEDLVMTAVRLLDEQDHEENRFASRAQGNSSSIPLPGIQLSAVPQSNIAGCSRTHDGEAIDSKLKPSSSLSKETLVKAREEARRFLEDEMSKRADVPVL
jgi:hypothetical protein